MSCLECKSDSPGAIRFRLLEVHTLHIRDFDGEKIIQALGEFQNYEICTACALEGARVFLYPAKLILRKFLRPFLDFTSGRFCYPFLGPSQLLGNAQKIAQKTRNNLDLCAIFHSFVS